ncbi:hypothetical protein AZI87_01560 [Bdellovibrio bacteriovorus]|uniref:DUF305 domain-containing protein n=1 Tax=Bdellovibrio bacteriovorus TaxID=959 RepID=A0A162GEY3_BDEBC|nr:DUF305 domain-containing protein [Bdellovibrio bacteriovorus]KYG67985.1 hypothetical protein AZI87_01560 [Bdellovibrio bacteriovorus]
MMCIQKLWIFVFSFFVLFLGNEVAFANGAFHKRPYSVKFIDEMSAHHEGGIKMAEMAIAKAYHSKLKHMAQMMKKDQQEELMKLQEWRRRWYSSSPEYTYNGAEMDMSKLERLSGLEFDIAFLDSMIMHHPGAIFLGNEAAVRSERSAIRNLGKRIAKAQETELNEMRALRDRWAID